MYWATSILFILFLLYAILIALYTYWYKKIKLFVFDEKIDSHVYFSIIIPARNEENNIGHCLQSIMQQQYSSKLFEVIVINDYSTDNTQKIVLEYQQKYANIKLINLQDYAFTKQLNSYKKTAITMAIQQAQGNWIITTDADCEVQPLWLNYYNNFIQQQQPVFVAAPVKFTTNKSLFSIFQAVDFGFMQAITAATVAAGFHSMCNGANMAYSKHAFNAVNGFKDIDDIASGDDMLLMHKIKQQYPQQVNYLFAAQVVVSTQPMPTLKSFINQRIRWASKADKYKDKNIFWALLIVYLFNVVLLTSLSIGYLLNTKFWIISVAVLLIKSFQEYILVKKANLFLPKISFSLYTLLQPLHLMYITIAGWLGKFGKYQWKNRRVN